MPNYYQIREKELKTTEDYSKKRFKRYLKLHKILLSLYSKLFFWSISFLPMIILPILFGQAELFPILIIAHFLFWYFKGDKMYHKDCDSDIEELKLTIQVLEDIMSEKFKK